MSASLTLKDKTHELQRQIDERMIAIAKSLPADIMAPDRFARAVVSLCQRAPALFDVNRATLLGAVLQCAHLGLDVDPTLGQAYVIPYKTKGGAIAQLQIGYRGFLSLAWRSAKIEDVSADVVREGDDFDWEQGTKPFLRHRPRAKLAAPITHAWAAATAVGARKPMFKVLTIEEVNAVRARSRAKDSGPWVSDFAAMAQKTALRRLCKLLPLSTEKDRGLLRAMDLDERAELGLKQELGAPFIVANEAPPPEPTEDEIDEQALADAAREAENKP